MNYRPTERTDGLDTGLLSAVKAAWETSVRNVYNRGYEDGQYDAANGNINVSPVVYLYKEYNEEKSYLTEIVEAYDNYDAAVRRLKERLESTYDVAFEYIPAELDFTENDTFREDYVSFSHGDATAYYVVERISILN